MNYLLNKELTLEAKGLLALVLHLQEANVKPTVETILKYSKTDDPSDYEKLSALVEQGYIRKKDDYFVASETSNKE